MLHEVEKRLENNLTDVESGSLSLVVTNDLPSHVRLDISNTS